MFIIKHCLAEALIGKNQQGDKYLDISKTEFKTRSGTLVCQIDVPLVFIF